jgi:hypothetical protein
MGITALSPREIRVSAGDKVVRYAFWDEVSPHAWGLRLLRAECGLALSPALVLPSGRSDAAGARNQRISKLDILPADAPFPRFKCGLTTALARLGARVARYAFPARLFHLLPHAGLSRRYPEQRSLCASLPFCFPIRRAGTTMRQPAARPSIRQAKLTPRPQVTFNVRVTAWDTTAVPEPVVPVIVSV